MLRNLSPWFSNLTQADQIDTKQAKQVWTGNPIPKGADAVVMLENTEKHGEEVEVWSQLAPWTNVSKVGEDLKVGDLVVKAGTPLEPLPFGLSRCVGQFAVEGCGEA